MSFDSLLGLLPVPIITAVCIFLLKHTFNEFHKGVSSAKASAQSAQERVGDVHRELVQIYAELIDKLTAIQQTSGNLHVSFSGIKKKLELFEQELRNQMDIMRAHREILKDAEIVFTNHFKLITDLKQEMDREKQNIRTIIKVLKNNNLLVSEDKSKK